MTPRLRALVVDDERLARVELLTLLRAHPEVEVVGEAADADEALRRMEALDPDVLFLDVQMPGSSGFELLERAHPRGRVVFVTAYDTHALRAFDVNALDYLLKPVHPERLAATVARLAGGDGDPRSPQRLGGDDHLWIQSDRAARFVKVRQIACILGAGDYTEVVTGDGKRTLVLRALKDWERRLPATMFARVHRGTLVNMEWVERIEPHGDESFRVILRGIDRPVPMSRRHAARLKFRLT
jgi:two-component system LytT family response regulator